VNRLSSIILGLAIVIGAKPVSSGTCKCGRGLGQRVLYEPPIADVGYPDPSVTRLTRSGRMRTIHIEVEIPVKKGEIFPVIYADLSSVNEGASWSRKSESKYFRWRSPADPKTVYEYGPEDRFLRSIDGGRHWVAPVFRIEGQEKEDFARRSLGRSHVTVDSHLVALHPNRASLLYARFTVSVFSEGDPNNYERSLDLPALYASMDGGDNWFEFAPSLRVDSPLGISPSDPNIMMAYAPSGVVKTVDGGKTWAPVGQQAELLRPAEQKGMAEAMAELRKKGERFPFWTKESGDWLRLHIEQIAFEPGNSNVIYLVTNKGLYQSNDGGASWCLLQVGKDKIGYVKSLFFEPQNPSRIYVGTEDRIMVSEDRGCCFQTIFDWQKLVKVYPELGHSH
jgi:hypothetical protein